MITVVSGLPRSGTSLMMQMLVAGGLPPLTDGIRSADTDNPRGYYEWERIKTIPQNAAVIGEAEGKVVKVISTLLMHLPAQWELPSKRFDPSDPDSVGATPPSGGGSPCRGYKVVFMRRPLAEVVKSQAEMIKRLQTAGPALPPAAMQMALEAHRKQVVAWVERQPHISVYWADYHEILKSPTEQAVKIQQFIGISLKLDAMVAQVDPTLHRQRV